MSPGWLLGVLLSATSPVQPAGPSADQVRQAINLIRHCTEVKAEQIDLLSLSTREMLQAMVMLTRHVEATSITSDAELGALLAWLRKQSGPADERQVFESLCADRQFEATQLALERLKPAPAVFDQRLAWVPLLGLDGDYPGLGLVFSLEPAGWRLQLRQSLVHQWVLVSPKFAALKAGMDHAGPGEHPGSPRLSRCYADPPREPADFEHARIVTWEDAVRRWQQPETLMPGPENAISALQRQALVAYAEGRSRPASPLAQAVHAEVLYRSAFFTRGPEPDSREWWAQLERALQFARLAEAGGISLKRFAPLITHFATLLETGSGTRPPDLAAAAEHYRWAARHGDDTAIQTYANYQWEGLGGLAADCAAAQRTLSESRASDDFWPLLPQAWIALDCPDPSQRDAAKVKQLLARIDAHEDNFLDEDEDLAPLRLGHSCMAAPELPGCASRKPLIYSGQYLQQQREYWAAQAADDTDSENPAALPQRLLELPRPNVEPDAEEQETHERRTDC